MKIYFLVFLFLLAQEGLAKEGEFLSPQNNGWVLNTHIPVAFVCSDSPVIKIKNENIIMKKTPHRHLWYGQIEWRKVGKHNVPLVAKCRKQLTSRQFTMNFFSMNEVTPAKQQAQNFMHKQQA
ncbi:MAG: hypothetical protein AABY86_02895, partial [Bdellovibrionota bacterium]